MCTSIENWLQADPLNVVVVHCLTGKGRTATVLSALLCWLNLDVGQGVGQSLTTMQVSQERYLTLKYGRAGRATELSPGSVGICGRRCYTCPRSWRRRSTRSPSPARGGTCR